MLATLSASHAEVFEYYRLREEQKAVLHPVLKFFFRSLKLDTSNEERSSASGLGIEEPSLNLSPGRHQYVDLRNIQAV